MSNIIKDTVEPIILYWDDTDELLKNNSTDEPNEKYKFYKNCTYCKRNIRSSNWKNHINRPSHIRHYNQFIMTSNRSKK